jgi:hypothetical protein
MFFERFDDKSGRIAASDAGSNCGVRRRIR